jgi:RNA 2',3'-cyclic 3'-phosphodiesterase
MRCFVAVDLPAETRDAIAQAASALRAANPRAEVSWVRPEKMHLTLKFLADLPDATAPRMEAALAEVAARHARFTLVAGGVGGFPSRTRPRVVWAGLTDGVREVGRLAADVELACEPLGFPLEARPFRGHLTIGRVRSPRGISRVVAAMDGFDTAVFGRWTVHEIALYRSHLHGSAGSTYERLGQFALNGVSATEPR